MGGTRVGEGGKGEERKRERRRERRVEKEGREKREVGLWR